MKFQFLLSTIVVLFIFAKNGFAQITKDSILDGVVFIGEQEIDSPYVVTFLPSSESIIIMKSDIPKIQNDTCFSDAILKTGYVYFLSYKFYSSFLFLKYNSNPLSGRNDSAIFKKYYKLIADDVNINQEPYKFGHPIIDNSHMRVYKIYESCFFIGVANIQDLDFFLGYEASDYSIPGISNLYVRFAVPLRSVLKKK
jgi:hypothetical protein